MIEHVIISFCLPCLISEVLRLNECLFADQRQFVSVNVCPHVSHTCLAKQLQQGGPATLSYLQSVLDNAEEIVQETETHLQQKTISVKCHRAATQHCQSSVAFSLLQADKIT